MCYKKYISETGRFNRQKFENDLKNNDDCAKELLLIFDFTNDIRMVLFLLENNLSFYNNQEFNLLDFIKIHYFNTLGTLNYRIGENWFYNRRIEFIKDLILKETGHFGSSISIFERIKYIYNSQ